MRRRKDATEMPNSQAYNRQYWLSKKATITLKRQERREAARADIEIVSRGTWLRALLSLHHLRNAELAALLGLKDHTITAWLLRPTSHYWEPMTDYRVAQIKALLPEDAPLAAEVIDRLKWSEYRREKYAQQWAHKEEKVS